MWAADGWQDYELIDASDGERLERWGKTVFIRPDPQVIWKNRKRSALWERYDARYVRSAKGGGTWERAHLPQDVFHEGWWISRNGLSFLVRPTGFKHTGVFPEQAVNWDFLDHVIRKATQKIRTADGAAATRTAVPQPNQAPCVSEKALQSGKAGTAQSQHAANPVRDGSAQGRPLRVLNLFAYTGGATIAAARAGASVCHVDAARGMVQWAKDNAKRSGLERAPIRYIVEDCKKFLEREIRRGNRYDGVVMDPPSYGRGPSGEVWRLEDGIDELVHLAFRVLSDQPLFLLVNSYTTGLSASTMGYLLGVCADRPKGRVECSEIGLPVTETGGILPAGCSARMVWDT